MVLRDHGRKTVQRIEGMLSLSVLVVVLAAMLLVYLAHGSLFSNAGLPPGETALLLNEAPSPKLATALGIDAKLAERLVALRARRGGFDSVDQILDSRLFEQTEADRMAVVLATARLDTRTATAKQFAAALKLPLPFAARLAAYRDTLIAPKAPQLATNASGSKPNTQAGNAASNTALPSQSSQLSQSTQLAQSASAGVNRLIAPKTLLRRAALLDAKAVRPLLPGLIVREPGTVLRHFAAGSLFFILILLVLPVWLRNRARLGGDPFLMPLALLLCGLGVVMLFSGKDPLRDVAAYQHHLIGTAIGLAAFVVCARLSPHARLRINNYRYLWVLGAGLLAVMLFLFGRGPEGVKLNLLGIQPVELIKLMLVFFLASYLSDRAELITDTSRRYTPPQSQAVQRGRGRPSFALSLPRRRDLAPVAILFAISLGLFYMIQDLGPGLLMFATFIALLYLTTARSSFLVIGFALMIAGGFIGYWRHIGVFATRVDMWLSPFANTHPNGMQLGQALWALASGGWSGSGLGLGMPGLIPRGQDDLAFISWTEEAGLPGAWLVLIVFAVLVWRGVCIALRASNDFDRALAFGLTALFGLQTLLILGGVTGLVPLTGIALPFLSYGDSALAADFILIGLLRGISAPPTGGVGRPEARPEVVRAGHAFAFGLAFLLIGVVGIYRLGQVQLWHADEYALRPVSTPDADRIVRPHQNPRLLAIASEIQRGAIYDRNGRVLATSRPKEILALERDPARSKRLIGGRVRLYPFGSALANLIGYTDPAIGGPAGFERVYNAKLRGYERFNDLLGVYRSRHMFGYVPLRGRDVHLTLDAVLQQEAQVALQKVTGRLKDRRNGKVKDKAGFVLLDPKTGDVIVAATTPAFNPNTLTAAQYHNYMTSPDPEEERPFINRAAEGFYPPGSTLKAATAACALDNLPDALAFRVNCNRVDNGLRWEANGVTYARAIHDDKGDPAFGALTLAPAFRVSSNIYFANLAVTIGAERLRATLTDKMHFSHAPGPKAFVADLADIGYGQGQMLASPLEMARLAASVANNGIMMKPRYLEGFTDPAKIDRDPKFGPDVLSEAMTAKTASTLRGLMRTVCTGGTAAGVFDDLPVAVAGKTGTAQNRQLDKEPHSWFIGFAPYTAQEAEQKMEQPQYAFACVVENGGYGKKIAAVVCRNILGKLFMKK